MAKLNINDSMAQVKNKLKQLDYKKKPQISRIPVGEKGVRRRDEMSRVNNMMKDSSLQAMSKVKRKKK